MPSHRVLTFLKLKFLTHGCFCGACSPFSCYAFNFPNMTREHSNRVFLISATGTGTGNGAASVHRKSKQIQKRAQERSPARLFVEDVFLLFKNFALFPHVFIPFRTSELVPEVKKHKWRTVYGSIILLVLGVVEGPLLLAAVPAFILLPGWLFTGAALACILVVHLLASTTWGSLVAESENPIDQTKFQGEKWFFINGIATR